MAKGKYKEWLQKENLLLLKGYARDGLTDKEISEKIHISYSTLYEWFNRYPEISEAIKEGRAPTEIAVEDTFIEKKLKGHFVEEEIQEKTIHRDKDGNITGTTDHIRKYKKYIPPDTTALIFYLKCRLGKRYNDKLNIVVDDKRNGQLAELIEGLQEDDIYSEAEIIDATMAEKET